MIGDIGKKRSERLREMDLVIGVDTETMCEALKNEEMGVFGMFLCV